MFPELKLSAITRDITKKFCNKCLQMEILMPRIAALYRYPVKGFTPEECKVVDVLDEGRIAGDRVLGIRFCQFSCDG